MNGINGILEMGKLKNEKNELSGKWIYGGKVKFNLKS